MCKKTISSFHALILAAGRGSRMRHLTESQPKCLTTICEKSLLDWQVTALHAAGASECTVMTGYLGHLLHGNFTTISYPRWAETNMVGTLAWAMRTLSQHTCIVSYSDIVYKTEHAQRLAASEYDIAIAYDTLWYDLWALRFDDPLSDAETFSQKNGLLQRIGARSACLENIEGQYMGLIKITPQGWEQITAYLASLPSATVDKLDMTALLSGLLARDVAIGTVPVAGGWCEVDSEQDLLTYTQALQQKGWSHDWRDG